MLAQFGPCLKWPWTKLEAPELSEALIDRMVEGTQAQAAGRSIRELERLRDDYLVAIQQVLRQYDIGAGSTLKALEERLYRDAGAGPTGLRFDAGRALRLVSTAVRPDWVDYNGHMSDFRYGQVFGDAMDVLYREVGVDEDYRRTGSHVRHLTEVKVSEPIYVNTQLLKVDDKRLHVFHELRRGTDDALIATGEQMHLHVDTAAAKASPMDKSVHAKLAAFAHAQSGLARPAAVGRHVGQARA
jgi:carnitine 3-dehydrogenase